MTNQQPPHDIAAEQALIGAALTDPTVPEAVNIRPQDFYRPNHELYWAIIQTLNGDQPDRAHALLQALQRAGEARPDTGPTIHACVAAGIPAAASQYARIIRGHAHARRAVEVLTHGLQAATQADPDDLDGHLWDLAAEVETLLAGDAATPTPTSYEAQPLDIVLAGGELDPPPDLMPRTDGAHLVYSGHVHSIAGESNAGKTWVALHAAAHCLAADQRVVFLDFEDRASRVVGRLIALDATPDQIRAHFLYVRPNRAITPQGKAVLERLIGTARLVIIDGVTEAMTLHGLEPKDQDIAKFYELLPRWIADHGPAVIDLDHTVKDRKQQGLYATGGQHKRAGLDGAGYILRVIEPIGRGFAGKVKLVVSKDRPGYVGKPGDTAAMFTLDATDETKVAAALEPPEPATVGEDGDFRPTHIMQKVSAFLALVPGAGMKEIKEAKLGQWPYVQKAVKALITEEYVHVEQSGRKHEHHNLRPFTEHDDPIDSTSWYDREPPEDEPW